MTGHDRLTADLGKIVLYEWLSKQQPVSCVQFCSIGDAKMEKHGMISVEATPPEDDTKCASEDALEEHTTKRLADQATEQMARNADVAPG